MVRRLSLEFDSLTLISHLGTSYADFLAHWLLPAHPPTTSPSVAEHPQLHNQRSTISISSYAKLVPSISLSLITSS